MTSAPISRAALTVKPEYDSTETFGTWFTASVNIDIRSSTVNIVRFDDISTTPTVRWSTVFDARSTMST
jgi:hypothetical protein